MKESIILFITTDFPPKKGGISSWAYEEYKKLVKSNKVILVIKNSKEYNSKYTKFFYKNHIELKKIFKYLIKNYEVKKIIFFHWEPAKSLLYFLLIKNYFYIIVLHGWEFLRPRSLFTKLKKKLILKFTREIWVTSPFMKKNVNKYGTFKNVKIVKIPIDNKFKKYDNEKIEILRKKYKIQNKKIIISVARLVERKGIFTVLKAIKVLSSKYKDLKYFIVGNGILKNKITNYVEQNNLTEVVELFGEVSDKELIDLYNISNLFILTPLEIKEHGDIEGFGIVYHEAHACGLPVIGSDTGGVKYALSMIDNSYLINPLDHNKLIELIEKVLYD